MPKVLVTGAAGFIGFHLCRRLLVDGNEIVGLDNLNQYYDPSLKEARLAELAPFAQFSFHPMELADTTGIERLFEAEEPPLVVNLAAQAGVRYSIENPGVYVQSNVVGFLNVLEACRRHSVKHLVFAS